MGNSGTQRREDLSAIQRCHDLLKDLLPRVEKFPRNHRFTLGDRIVRAGLDVLELLVQAAYRRDKGALLGTANVRLETLRHLVRLARELGPLPNKGYERVTALLSDLGKQIGGWRKHTESRDAKNAEEPVP